MEGKNILFTSVGRRVELIQEFRRARQRLGVEGRIHGCDISNTAPALRFCDSAHMICRIDDPDYIPDLLRLCSEEKIDLVIPTIDTDLLLLAGSRERFEAQGVRILISDLDKVRLCRDKRKTARYFTSLGLNAPETCDDVNSYAAGFPCFIKPRDGSSSIDAYRADTREQLLELAERVPQYVIQPFISGREYTIDICCDLEGRPLYITPRERLAVRSGEVLKTKIVQDSRMIAEAQTLIRSFRPRGPITVQLIRDERTGEDWFIEINPRYGGGAPLSIKAGADSPAALWRLLYGLPAVYQPDAAEDGAVYSRYDQSIRVDRRSRLTVDSVLDAESMLADFSAVIFDLDDTLYLERDYVRSGFRAAAAQVPELPAAETLFCEAFERGEPAIDAVLAAHGLEEKKDQCLSAYRTHFPTISLYPGVKEMLKRLREQGKRLAILTDGRPEGQRAKIEALGLEPLVDEILITDELGGAMFRKPNDIGFRILQTKLGIPFSGMVYVGDNPAKDFQAPDELGMGSVFFRDPMGLYTQSDFIR